MARKEIDAREKNKNSVKRGKAPLRTVKFWVGYPKWEQAAM